MKNRILVTYASRAGSTAGVADAIGQTLVEQGLQVDVLPMAEVKDLSPYQAVIAGSAIRGQKWLPEAMQFVNDHRSELSRKPFAAFMVCITLSMTNAGQYLEGLKSWMSPVRDLVRPVSEGYFAGALDFSKLPFSLNVTGDALCGFDRHVEARRPPGLERHPGLGREPALTVAPLRIMHKPCIYEIHVEGVLEERWSDWFEGLAVCPDQNGETTLRGLLVDQAALFNVLTRIHALNLELVYMVRRFPE